MVLRFINRMLRYALTGCLVCVSFVPAMAEEAAKPNPDAVLEQLLAIPPAELAAHIQSLKARLAETEQASIQLKQQAEAKTAEAEAIAKRIAPLMPKPPAPATTVAAAPKKEMPKVEMAAAPAITWDDDIEPIFAQRCFSCHNDEEQKGGLTLNAFSMLMNGGSSGEVIARGDAAGSRLVRLIEWEAEPIMPPEGDPLEDEQIEMVRKWIDLGAPENKGSKLMLAAAPDQAGAEVFLATEIKDGPPPMPEVALAPVHPPSQRPMAARAMATSPTSSLMAVGGDRQVVLYNLENYEVLGALPYPEGDVFTLTFSLNGELLLVGGGEEGKSAAAALYEVRTTKRMGTYKSGYDTILAAEITPDHRMVILGGPDRRVRAFDSATGAKLYELDKHTDWIYSIKVTPDGELLATADRAGNLFFWQAANGRFVETLSGHDGAIHDMAYTLDSNVLATAGNDGKVFLWDTWKYSRIRTVNAHGSQVFSVHFNKDNQFVTSARDGTTKRWALDGKEQKAYEKLPDWAYQTRFGAQGGVVITGDWAGELAVWKADDGARLATLTTNPATPPPPAPDKVAAKVPASGD